MKELVLVWILSLPQFYREEFPSEVREKQVHAVAEAIAKWSGDDRVLAATLVAIGHHETKFLERIQAGRCQPWECDRGFARGYFQVHEDASPLARRRWNDLIGLEPQNIDAAVAVTVDILRRGFRRCRTMEGAVSYYADGWCRTFRGAPARAKTAKLLLSR